MTTVSIQATFVWRLCLVGNRKSERTIGIWWKLAYDFIICTVLVALISVSLKDRFTLLVLIGCEGCGISVICLSSDDPLLGDGTIWFSTNW